MDSKTNCTVLRSELKKRKMSILQLSFKASISSASLYAAVNGTIPFWPGWRSRVAEVLDMSEADLFPECDDHEEGK